MRQRLNKISRCVLFLGILLLLLLLCSGLFRPKDNWEADGMREVDAFGVLGEPAGTLDVLILGDSLAKCSVSPLRIWENYGISSYVCSTGNQRLYESRDIAKQVFETQKPKMLLVEADALYAECPRMDILTNGVENILPVIRYHDRWKTLEGKDWLGKTAYTYTDSGKGFHVSVEISPAELDDYMKPSEKVKEVPKTSIKYLKQIQKLCSEQQTVLMLYSAPSTTNWSYKRHNGVEQVARALEIDYMDMNLMGEQIPIDWQVDTMDDGNHLNCTGAEKVSVYLGGYLAQSGLFSDKRTDPAYSGWNQAAEALNERILELMNG